MLTPSDNNGKFEIPSWFKAENAVQEHIVAQEQAKDAALERMVDERLDQAKRSALPKATEYIREIYSRSKALRRGKCQVWTNDTWRRVQEHEYKSNHPVRYFFRTVLQSIGSIFKGAPDVSLSLSS